MKRQRSLAVTQRNQVLLEQIKELKRDHPFWGYRRVWSYLKYRQGISVNKKRIYRLMKERGFLVTPNMRLKAKRHATRPKPRATRPNQLWGIDMTNLSACRQAGIRMTTWGWLYLTVVLDWYKEIVGFSLGLRSKTED